MITIFKNFSILILVLLLLIIVYIFAWLFPSAGLILGMTVFLFGLVIASFAVARKHRLAYLQGKITCGIFIRNVLVEIFGILLAMVLAGLLGRYIAQIATEHINNDLTRLIAGILVGLLTGAGVTILVKCAWIRVAIL